MTFPPTFFSPLFPPSASTCLDLLGLSAIISVYLNLLIIPRFKLDPRHGPPLASPAAPALSRYSKMPNTASALQSLPQHLGDPERDQSPAEYSSGIDSDNDAVGLNGSSSSRALKRKRPLTVSYVPESTVPMPRMRLPRRPLIN